MGQEREDCARTQRKPVTSDCIQAPCLAFEDGNDVAVCWLLFLLYGFSERV